MPNIFELKTVQTNIIKVLSEALKEILTDTNIICDSNGLTVGAMDTSQSVIVYLNLNKDNFEHYYCAKREVIGINMINLFKVIKTLTNNDTLTLFINDEDRNKLGIKKENTEKNICVTYYMNLMDLNEDQIVLPDDDNYESIVTMPSVDFQKICREAYTFSEIISIENISKQLIFSCKGGILEQRTVTGETNAGMNFIKHQNPGTVIQGYYNLKHLFSFTKCTNLCNNVQIFMKNDYPIMIQFKVGNLGNLKLYLAPQYDGE